MEAQNYIRTITTTYTVQDASGPNPENKPVEVVDDSGFRVEYFDDASAAEAFLWGETLNADAGELDVSLIDA